MLERYYVDCSSYFVSHKYDIDLIQEVIKKNGGKNVRKALKYGWSNLPSVVTFNADEITKERIQDALEKELGTPWIIIKKKDWL